MEEKFKFYAFKLSGFIVLIFILQLLIPGFTELFLLNGQSWVQPWRFLTSIFLHAGVLHIAYNLFALLLFGSILEKLIGGKKFLCVFFISGIIGNLVAVNFYSASLGASGAIMGVIGAIVIIRPMLPIFAFGLPMPMFVAGIVWVVGNIIGTYGFVTGNPLNNTGNIAHLSGMAFGFLFGIWYLWKYKIKNKRNEKHTLDENYVRKWEEHFMKIN